MACKIYSPLCTIHKGNPVKPILKSNWSLKLGETHFCKCAPLNRFASYVWDYSDMRVRTPDLTISSIGLISSARGKPTIRLQVVKHKKGQACKCIACGQTRAIIISLVYYQRVNLPKYSPLFFSLVTAGQLLTTNPG